LSCTRAFLLGVGRLGEAPRTRGQRNRRQSNGGPVDFRAKGAALKERKSKRDRKTLVAEDRASGLAQ
jgi:hypothetical protein